MKKLIIVVAFIIVLGTAYYSVKSSGKFSSNSQARVENTDNQEMSSVKATDFTLKDLGGKQVSLKDLRGKNVYLNFFATWCGPCQAEMPDIEKLYQETKNSDLVIIAVNLGEDSNTVKNFISAKKYNFQVLLDSDNKAANAYSISAIPVSIFIDKGGNIKSKMVGEIDYKTMKENIENIK